MRDGCGCCKVCARQLFEDCGKRQPCDRAKGLECNYGGTHNGKKGICRGRIDCSLTFIVSDFMTSELFLCHVSYLIFLFLGGNQLNQMEDPASTTTGSTRTGRTSVQTVNTSAPAWMEPSVVSPSVPMWSFYPCWVARTQSGSKYLDNAVTSLCVLRRLFQWRKTWKSTIKIVVSLKTSSVRGGSWAQGGDEPQGLYQVSKTDSAISKQCNLSTTTIV